MFLTDRGFGSMSGSPWQWPPVLWQDTEDCGRSGACQVLSDT